MDDIAETFARGVKLFNAKDIDALMQLFHRDCRMVMPGGETLGRDDVAEMYRMMTLAYPDGSFEIARTLRDGATLTVELRFAGSQTGPLFLPEGQIPTTGKRVTYRTCDVVDFRDGKIAEWHAYFDKSIILAQLGLD